MSSKDLFDVSLKTFKQGERWRTLTRGNRPLLFRIRGFGKNHSTSYRDISILLVSHSFSIKPDFGSWDLLRLTTLPSQRFARLQLSPVFDLQLFLSPTHPLLHSKYQTLMFCFKFLTNWSEPIIFTLATTHLIPGISPLLFSFISQMPEVWYKLAPPLAPQSYSSSLLREISTVIAWSMPGIISFPPTSTGGVVLATEPAIERNDSRIPSSGLAPRTPPMPIVLSWVPKLPGLRWRFL